MSSSSSSSSSSSTSSSSNSNSASPSYNQSAPASEALVIEIGSTSEHIPVVKHLGEIYHHVPDQRKRFIHLESQFETLYKRKPQFYARAPGRVNLIGEHIDYMGYSVLPMSIENDTLIAVATSSPTGNPDEKANLTIQVAHSRSDLSTATYDTDASLSNIDLTTSGWLAYIQCGLRGIINDSGLRPVRRPIQMLVTGNVPMAAGLSSSSSLVCATALAAGHAFGVDKILNKKKFADLCCQAERHIGTMGGGMDQAISFLGKKDVAKRIDFEDPIVTTDVVLPSGGIFVVANSITDSAKAEGTSPFNVRVLECQLGALLLAKALNIDLDKVDVGRGKGRGTRTLKCVQQSSKLSCSDLITSIRDKQWLHPAAYTQKEIEKLLGVDLMQTFATTPKLQQVLADPRKTNYYVYQRVMHVYSEAQRVDDFQAACKGSGSDQVSTLGELMNASHASCRDQFDCSCPELDKLVEACNHAGALGARLTGAGWGGCVVALVREEDVNKFIDQVKKTYYHSVKHIVPDDPKLNNMIFASKPGAGAAIYLPSENDLHGNGGKRSNSLSASPQSRLRSVSPQPRSSSRANGTSSPAPPVRAISSPPSAPLPKPTAVSTSTSTSTRSCCAGKSQTTKSPALADHYMKIGLITLVAGAAMAFFIYARTQRSRRY